VADKKPGIIGLVTSRFVEAEEGAIGYIAAWLMGVPASILFIIFLMRGCN